MEPLTLASAFATIVGLLNMFKQERKSEADQGRDAFLSWLDEHRFGDLKKAIESSHQLLTEIDGVLRQDRDVLLTRLKNIDEILATLASKIEGFGDISRALHPGMTLSDQAISVLRQFVQSDAKEFLKWASSQGDEVAFLRLLNATGDIQIEDKRFIDDDLATLVNFGLLHFRMSSQGSEIYGITRNSVKLIEAIDAKTT